MNINDVSNYMHVDKRINITPTHNLSKIRYLCILLHHCNKGLVKIKSGNGKAVLILILLSGYECGLEWEGGGVSASSRKTEIYVN